MYHVCVMLRFRLTPYGLRSRTVLQVTKTRTTECRRNFV